MFIVSACLLGKCCKYSGSHNYSAEAEKFLQGKQYIQVCPEVLGGLSIPRPPAEIQGDRIINNQGADVTQEFMLGSKRALAQAQQEAEALGQPIEGAILKANSPSCGAGRIYDGSFSGRKIPGHGCFAKLLKEQGIPVLTEEEL